MLMLSMTQGGKPVNQQGDGWSGKQADRQASKQATRVVRSHECRVANSMTGALRLVTGFNSGFSGARKVSACVRPNVHAFCCPCVQLSMLPRLAKLVKNCRNSQSSRHNRVVSSLKTSEAKTLFHSVSQHGGPLVP